MSTYIVCRSCKHLVFNLEIHRGAPCSEELAIVEVASAAPAIIENIMQVSASTPLASHFTFDEVAAAVANVLREPAAQSKKQVDAAAAPAPGAHEHCAPAVVPAPGSAHAPDTMHAPGAEQVRRRPRNIEFVLDGSAAVAGNIGYIMRCISTMLGYQRFKFGLWLCAETAKEVVRGSSKSALRDLQRLRFPCTAPGAVLYDGIVAALDAADRAQGGALVVVLAASRDSGSRNKLIDLLNSVSEYKSQLVGVALLGEAIGGALRSICENGEYYELRKHDIAQPDALVNIVCKA